VNGRLFLFAAKIFSIFLKCLSVIVIFIACPIINSGIRNNYGELATLFNVGIRQISLMFAFSFGAAIFSGLLSVLLFVLFVKKTTTNAIAEK